MAKWDVVIWGRIAGALIIAAGIALAAWDAVELDDYPIQGSSFPIRYFFERALSFLGTGALVIVGAEIAHRLWNDREAPLPGATEDPPPAA